MNDATKLSLRWVLGFHMEAVSRNEAVRRTDRAHRWLQLHETTLRRVARLVCALAPREASEGEGLDAVLAAAEPWVEDYGELEYGGMTQLDHGHEEYEKRIQVILALRAALAERAA